MSNIVEVKSITRGQKQYRRNPVAFRDSTDKWLSKSGNTERALAKAREYKKNNRDKINAQRRLRRQTDPIKKIADNCRTRLREIFLGRGGKRHGKPIRKTDKTIRLIGCSYQELRTYLEKQFSFGMTWQNYGKGKDKWIIDHIEPICSFDLRIKDNQYKAFHYTNLQPLWYVDHVNKTSLDRDKCLSFT